MNYHHLTIEERSCIRKYYVDGLSYREIARLIGRDVSTVSREIRRNCTHMYDIPTYYPHTAQKKYLLRRSYCHRGDVPFTGSDRLHRGKAAGDLVAGADRLYPVRTEDAKLAYHLPVDLREIPGKRQSEGTAPQGKEPRSERNAREIQ